jgi:hypothetical protein
MLLKWGIEEAKKRDYEFWLNATRLGRPLYEKYGLKVVEENPVIPKTDSPDEKWKQIEKEMGDLTFWAMWLPNESWIKDGETVKPWDKA